MARLAASALLVGFSLTLLGLVLMDSAAARSSVRMHLRKSYVPMALKFGVMSKFGEAPLRDDWNIVLPSLLRYTEAKARAADKRLMKISPNLHAQLIGTAVSRGPVRKIVSMYKRYRSLASCGNFKEDAEMLNLVAERHYQSHMLNESNRVFSSAMERFQRGIDCYATRFVEVLLGRSSLPGLGLEGLSSGTLDKQPMLEFYRQAATHNARLRHLGAFAWQTVARLDSAVSFILAMTDFEDETLSDAIWRARVEMDSGLKSDLESSNEQALLKEESDLRPEDLSTPAKESHLPQEEGENVIESVQELLSRLGFDVPAEEVAEERSSDSSPLTEADSPPTPTERRTTAPAEKTEDEESDLLAGDIPLSDVL